METTTNWSCRNRWRYNGTPEGLQNRNLKQPTQKNKSII